MTDKEKIRKEVEKIARSINPYIPDEEGKNSEYEAGRFTMATQIMQIIDSLQEEPISEELEKAAVEAFKKIVDSDKNNFLEIFNAGAEWQKQHMIKDAISCKLCWYDGFYLDYTEEELCNVVGKRPLEVGNVLKVIIIKDD